MNIYQKIKKKYDFEAPQWWECQWRRNSCQKRKCRLCVRIIRDRERHIKQGDDPD